MKKMTLITVAVLFMASLIYFKRQSKTTSTDNSIPDQMSQSDESSRGSLESDSKIQPSRPTQEAGKVNDVSADSSQKPSTSIVGAEKNQEWYKNFESSLSQNVVNLGMTQEVADCIVAESQQNLKREKPLDFDGLSDSCAIKYQLTKAQRDGLRNALRNASSASQGTIDIDAWRSCMLSKYNAGTCISDLIIENFEAFYAQNSGSAPMGKNAFQKERQADIEKVLEKALKECPNSLDQFNGVYSSECT